MMIKEVVAINEKIRNTLWQDATEKEIENVKISFQIIPNGEKAPNGYQYVNGHMVFDIIMEDFHRKA